jgi:hypothetical protein
VSAILVAVVLMIGCADSPSGSRDGSTDQSRAESGVGSDGSSTLPSCDDVCGHIVVCNIVDKDTCLADCARSRRLLQPDAIQRMAVCAHKSCPEEPTCTREAQFQCTPLTGAAAVVSAYCNKKQQCDPSIDLSKCRDDFELTVICFSQAGLDRAASCISSMPCGSFLSGIGTCMAS